MSPLEPERCPVLDSRPYTCSNPDIWQPTPWIPPCILVVDDEQDILRAARLLLKRHFASVETLSDPGKLEERVLQGSFDVLLLDMNFAAGADSGVEGLESLDHVMALDPHAVVVLITAHSGVELAVEAMKRGATDFVTKPWQNERLLATLLAACNLRRSRLEAAELRNRNRGLAAATLIGHELIGTSARMLRVFDTIVRAAPTDANVLILGENGTGKELVAREIHRHSRRADDVFLRVDLGALSPQLFESELFGHRRGAFTDAKSDRTGLFRAAAGGTLFLDEIGNDAPASAGQIAECTGAPRGNPRRSGEAGSRGCPRDLRHQSIAAGARGPESVSPGPALPDQHRGNHAAASARAALEDIPLLLEHFMAVYAEKYNVPARRLSAAALEALAAHPWPGNVRALRHAVERALILSAGSMLEPEDFTLGSTGPESR